MSSAPAGNFRDAEPSVAERLLSAARRLEPGGADEEFGGIREALREIDPFAIPTDSARLAFWTDTYNALLLGEVTLRPRAGTLVRHRGMFDEVGCVVGGESYSLNDIEHGVLRRNRRAPYGLRRRFRRGDRRSGAAPSRLDERIHFALNCGARSCPPVHTFSADSLDSQLEIAATAYIRGETDVDRRRGILRLPGVMRLYRADFGGRRDQARYAAARLEDRDREWVLGNAGSIKVRWARFDWTMTRASAEP